MSQQTSFLDLHLELALWDWKGEEGVSTSRLTQSREETFPSLSSKEKMYYYLDLGVNDQEKKNSAPDIT